jgi:hypothetical protein
MSKTIDDFMLEVSDMTEEIQDRGKIINEKNSKIVELESKINHLQPFADLWYFAMDEKPLEFELIVTTCLPKNWLTELSKLKSKLKKEVKS